MLRISGTFLTPDSDHTLRGAANIVDSPEPSVLQIVLQQSSRALDTYRIDPGLIQEHVNGERRIKEGGYGDRQIYELVQNGADELRNDQGGEIAVILTSTHLYCANQGVAMTPEGADTILRMGVSRKRGGQIGRFGVGVKSVLSITDLPQFFSREDDRSFGFDREWAAEQIKSVHPDADETPVLRMARPLDRDRAVQADPILSQLLTWATTVVRLPLKPSAIGRLANDIKTFPKEFCLFSRHVGTVTLEDRRDRDHAVKRQIFQHVEGDRSILQVDRSSGKSETDRYRVFSRTHRPSIRALGDAGELHDRPEIDISWAVADRVGRETALGRFWAYFPTNYTTTLRGIINAPWKTSEDRQNLYGANAFNDELINTAAELIVESLPLLTREDDPCAHLDQMPARGREEPQWAAKDLVGAVWSATVGRPTLPDQDGEFGATTVVRLHPADLKPQWLALWAGHAGRPKRWCHHSVERFSHRRQSAERMVTAAGESLASIGEWIEALVEDETPEASAAAILIVAGMKHEGHPLAEEAARARIVLTDSLGLVAPSNRVYRRISDDGLAENTVYVNDRVLMEPVVARALDALGVHEADHAGRFASVLEQGFQGYGDRDWTAFWELSRLAGPADTLQALCKRTVDTRKELKVRTMSGDFRRIADCLLPGRIVPADGSRDAGIALDLSFHEAERIILRDLGLLETPTTGIDPREEPWYRDYVETFWTLYCKKLSPNAPRPQMSTMRFDGAHPAGPLHFLTRLSKEGRAAFVRELPDAGLVTTWRIQHGGHRSTSEPVQSPLRWMANKYGFVRTSQGLRRVLHSVGPQLRRYADVLPVADVPPSVSMALKLPGALDGLPGRIWKALVEEASRSTDDAFPGKVYALLIEADGAWPDDATTRCRIGEEWSSEVEDHEIAVTAVRAEYDALIRERVPALLVPSDEMAERMREGWRMRSPADVIQQELRFVPLAEPSSLVEEFPLLKTVRQAQVDGWSVTRCGELEEITRTPDGMRSRTIPEGSRAKEHMVYVLNPEDDLAALEAVDRVLKLALGAEGCKGVLQRREQQRNNERMQRARKATDPAGKMLELVDADRLKSALPHGLIESDEAERGQAPDARRVAELAADAFGSDLLRVYRKDIEANVPEAAAGFHGDTRSLRLVSELGLTEAYAGVRSETLPPVEVVSGPTEYPRLHDYQEKLATKMFDLLTRYRAPRAMLCLPTGAGKTRVAAEAVIRVIKEKGIKGRPILWIAQTAELCEQAVQSWSFVWSKVGPPERLTINRLWHTRDAAAVKETAHLVVATVAKLDACLDKEEYTWLRDPALVIIDEAHFSIAPQYTKLLGQLGITHRSDARPLIGLTATPYRGFNEDETRRLVDRYSGMRLDEGVFDSDPYVELQDLGVLAKVEHRRLEGATMVLTAEELDQAAATPGRALPKSAEIRLGTDADRNRMLIGEIEALPANSPVLLFATSVDHAKLMAAKLNGRGIRSAAIDSATPEADRRARIEEFRDRKIRVLTNYGVLAQGFDAPATEVVMVARPTYSPNAYQQMIGRGLRGPKNGGKKTCLILDVADNITNYNNKLAFTEFEYLWTRS